jgi:hypothetical protein
MDLDVYYKAAGKTAGAAAKDVVLVAQANHLDNFTLWIARTIDGGIVDAFAGKEQSDAHVDWFNRYCAASRVQRARGYADDIPERNPLVRAIAKELYEEGRS